jgi:hypothetical protein
MAGGAAPAGRPDPMAAHAKVAQIETTPRARMNSWFGVPARATLVTVLAPRIAK